MPVSTAARTAAQPGEFAALHGYTALNALQVCAWHMRAAVGEAQPGYDALQDDPERRAAQDKTLMTTNGLLGSARALTEAADTAAAAAAGAAPHAIAGHSNEEDKP